MSRFLRQIQLLAGTAVAALLCSSALAATPAANAEARARYQQDLADCNRPDASQHPITCRREARNALAAALRGELHDNPDQYRQNALRRCDAYQGPGRVDCEARMGTGSHLSGSVGGGGILRESITIVPVN